MTFEADGTKVESTPLVSGRAASNTSCVGSSVHSGVYFDPKGREPFGEGVAIAPATSDNVLRGPDQKFAALRAGDAKRLTEHIPDRYAQLFSKGVRVLKRDGRKILPKPACMRG